MATTYIILSKPHTTHSGCNALGHEIHITRFILFDLLQKKCINNETFIVTINQDRFFLYTNTFNNVIEWSDYNKFEEIIKQESNIIDLTFYSDVKNNHAMIPEFTRLNYHFDLFEKTDKFVQDMNNLHFCDFSDNNYVNYQNVIKEKYIVIHWRTNIFGQKSTSSALLLDIIHKLKTKKNINIVIFSSENLDTYIEQQNVYVIHNLQLFASFLQYKNCDLFISEWSGGGQLSQYCYNGKIMYFFANYPSNNYEIYYNNYKIQANFKKNIFHCWDFKTTTNCNCEYYKTINDLIEYL